jgi:hypothetical protein
MSLSGLGVLVMIWKLLAASVRQVLSCFLAKEKGIQTCEEYFAYVGCEKTKLPLPQLEVFGNVVSH